MASMGGPGVVPNDQYIERYSQAMDALQPWINSLAASIDVLGHREYHTEGKYPEIPTDQLLKGVEQAKLALAGMPIECSIRTVDKSEELGARIEALGTDFRELAFALINETDVPIPEITLRVIKATKLLNNLVYADL
jgi:hypothetical protein